MAKAEQTFLKAAGNEVVITNRVADTEGHRVSDPRIGLRERCPNCVQNGGESRQFWWSRVDGALIARSDSS